MAENNENLNNQNQGLDPNGIGQGQGEGQGQQDTPPKTYTQEELDALLKDAEAKGYGKGKFDTNAKWEKTSKERERLAKEEAEKQARFEKMSELEKAQTQAKEYLEKFQALEDEIALNKQKDETRKLMKEKGLSDSFLDSVLVFKDAEATLAKIEEIKTLFDAEVQKAVEAKIKVHVPNQNTNPEDGGFTLEMAKKALKIQ